MYAVCMQCIEISLVLITQKELVLMTLTRRWYAGLLIFWLNPCVTYSSIPQQRRWHLLIGASPLYAQYTKKAIQRMFPTTAPLSSIICKIVERILKRALLSFLSDTINLTSSAWFPTPSVLSLQYAGLRESGDAHDERGSHS